MGGDIASIRVAVWVHVLWCHNLQGVAILSHGIRKLRIGKVEKGPDSDVMLWSFGPNEELHIGDIVVPVERRICKHVEVHG